MTLFGKQISLAVLVAFVVSVVTAVGGGIVTVANGWGTKDPSATLALVVGVVGTVGSALIHTWDSMPNAQPPASQTPKVVTTTTVTKVEAPALAPPPVAAAPPAPPSTPVTV